MTEDERRRRRHRARSLEDLHDAITWPRDSEVLREALGEHVHEYLIRNKREEWDDYKALRHPLRAGTLPAGPLTGPRSRRRRRLARTGSERLPCPMDTHGEHLTPALDAARQRRKTLHDALVHLEEAISARPRSAGSPEWTALVVKESVEVRDAFDQHVVVTEKPDGLYDEILDRAPRLAGNVRRLSRRAPGDRRDGEGDAGPLGTGPESGSDAWPLDDARDDLQRFIGKVIRHRQRGADLVWEAYNVDIGGLE